MDLDSEGYLDLDLGLGMFNKDEFHRGVLVGLSSSGAPKICKYCKYCKRVLQRYANIANVAILHQDGFTGDNMRIEDLL